MREMSATKSSVSDLSWPEPATQRAEPAPPGDLHDHPRHVEQTRAAAAADVVGATDAGLTLAESEERRDDIVYVNVVALLCPCRRPTVVRRRVRAESGG